MATKFCAIVQSEEYPAFRQILLPTPPLSYGEFSYARDKEAYGFAHAGADAPGHKVRRIVISFATFQGYLARTAARPTLASLDACAEEMILKAEAPDR